MLATPAGVYAIGLVQKPASINYGLSQAFLLMGDRGALRPDPPLVAGFVPPGPGGAVFVFFSVLFLIGVVVGF